MSANLATDGVPLFVDEMVHNGLANIKARVEAEAEGRRADTAASGVH